MGGPRALSRVAVLDDDIRFIRLVERVLRGLQLDIQPVTTPDIDEAVRVVRVTGCDAALAGLHMYGRPCGCRFVEKPRSEPATSDLPVILTSAAHREGGRHVEFLVQHRCGVLLKPSSVQELAARLGELQLPRPAEPGRAGRARMRSHSGCIDPLLTGVTGGPRG